MSTIEPQIGRVATDVEVRLRSDEYASDEAVYLCHAPITELEAVIKQAKWWGVQIDGNTYADVSGQFVIGRGGAFFEVIVSTGGDE